MTTLQGVALNALGIAIQEHFAPGKSVEVFLGLPKDLSSEELRTIREELRRQGVKSKVEMGYNPWANTLRLQFQRPAHQEGVGFPPLVIMIIGALGAVGIGGVLGWKVGNVVETIGNSVGRSLIPLTMVFGSVYLLSKLVETR